MPSRTKSPAGSSTGLRLDERSDVPLFKQIFDGIAARVRSGAFPAGFRLPPTRTLADELGTHRNTVVRAYEELEDAGFLTSTVGRGTFVAAGAAAPAPVANPQSGGLPWTNLLSRAAEAEPLGRFDRLARRTVNGPSPTAINLARMQPSPDLIPTELFRRCVEHTLRSEGAKILGYAPREGIGRLRALIAQDLVRQGIPAAESSILITSGSQQGLDLIVRALVNPGDPFLVDASTYAGTLNLLAAAGARLIGVPSDDDGPDLAALDRLARSGAKGLYLMPSSHNPTGARIGRDRREALVDWSRRAGVPLIEDDYAADLRLDDDAPPPALRTLDGDVIYVGTFSKKLIPALRIGFLLAPPAIHPRLLALKHAMDLGTSPVLQHALAEFLERGYLRPHLARIIPEYRRRRDALERGLAQHLPRQLRWRTPRQGVSLWLPVPAPLSAEALHDEAQRRGVVVSPGSLNAVDPDGKSAGGIRLTFCCEPVDRLAEGARRLGQAAHALLGRQRRQDSERTTPAYGHV